MRPQKIKWNPRRKDATGITNDDRANRAESALQWYINGKGESTDAIREMGGYATDLIADLLHFLAGQQEDPEAALKTALMHFEAER